MDGGGIGVEFGGIGVELGGIGVGDGVGVPVGGIMGASLPVGGNGDTLGGKPPGCGTAGERVAGGKFCGGTAGAAPGAEFPAAMGDGGVSGPNGNRPVNGARSVPENGNATTLVPN